VELPRAEALARVEKVPGMSVGKLFETEHGVEGAHLSIRKARTRAEGPVAFAAATEAAIRYHRT